MTDQPLVSCLMVSLMSPTRQTLIGHAIDDFCAQTYPNRELVLVADHRADPGVMDQVRGTLHQRQIRHRLEVSTSNITLGSLRNRSREIAAGDLHCVWDDDDRYHPERLESQVTALLASGKEGLCLAQVMQVFPASGELYVTNWTATESGGFPGSLLLRQGSPVRYPETGDESRLGEDTHLLGQLRGRDSISHLTDRPHLYVYQSHGANSWDQGHHAMLARTLGMSAGLLKRREAEIRANLAWLKSGPLTVRGPAGPAFELSPAGPGQTGSTSSASE